MSSVCRSKKAPLGAFFAFWTMILAVDPAAAMCDADPGSMRGGQWRISKLSRVIDGDTLELEGGDRVRVVGINAPETPKPDKPGDPLGIEAMQRLQTLLKDQRSVALRADRGKRDHWGRLLLHPFLPDGTNLTAALLEQGMGFHVVIPPNDWQADCYHAAEQAAIDKHAGVWAEHMFDPVPADDMTRLHGGYLRVKGRIERISLTQKTTWIDLQGAVSLKFDRRHMNNVDGVVWKHVLEAHQNHTLDALPPLEVRGWMLDRRQWSNPKHNESEKGERKPFQFNIRHRYDWKLQEPTRGT